MLDVDFIPKVISKMVDFLKPKLPSDLVLKYKVILDLDPLEQKSVIQRELKPYELCLDDFIESLIKKHGMEPKKFNDEDLHKFKRYLSALCEAV